MCVYYRRMKKTSSLLAYLALCAIALTASFNAYAEIVSIAAPHIGVDKTLRMQVFVPEGKADARRPAAIMMHGCGGIGKKDELNARHAMWKDWLLERGFVVVFPESFTSRGVDQICTQKFSTRTIRQSDRLQDVLAARAWLEKRADVDAKRLIVWGWSHGGGTALAAATREVKTENEAKETKDAKDAKETKGEKLAPKFAQVISFYPGCTQYAKAVSENKSKAVLNSPLMLIIGEADDWTPAAPCKVWIDALKDSKQDARIVTYPGAFHDFDSPNGKLQVRNEVPNGVNPGKGVTVGPDPVAREDAKKRIDALLRERGLIASTGSKPASPLN
jgi:dienelactone hydrolase